MNETRRKPTTGRQSPSLFDKWHGIVYRPSRIDDAGHTKAFDYPVAEHWGESQNVQFRGWDSNRQHIGPEVVSHTGIAWRKSSISAGWKGQTFYSLGFLYGLKYSCLFSWWMELNSMVWITQPPPPPHTHTPRVQNSRWVMTLFVV